MPDPYNSPDSTQAVFCVCASDDVVRAAADCSNDTGGFFFAGAFADYITAEKRPHFPPVMKAAAGCVALIDFDKDPALAVKSVERLRQIFLKRISIIAVGHRREPDLVAAGHPPWLCGIPGQARQPAGSARVTASLCRQSCRRSAGTQFNRQGHGLLRRQRRCGHHHSCRAPRSTSRRRSRPQDPAHRSQAPTRPRRTLPWP